MGALRLLRPFLVAAAIVPLFLKPVVTSGHGLDTELVLAAVGIALGLLAASLITVFSDKVSSRVVTAAGWAYALLWIVVIGLRAAFSYLCGADLTVVPNTGHLIPLEAPAELVHAINSFAPSLPDAVLPRAQ